MKKMTKILSLVLALAMVLGMTAFAGTPTKIIFSDSPSSAEELTLGSWKTGREALGVTVSTTITASGVEYPGGPTYTAKDFFGDSTATKFYYNGTMNPSATLAERYGKTVLSTTQWTGTCHPFAIGYRLATPWTYTANKDSDVALVASLELAMNKGYSTQQRNRDFQAHLYKAAKKDAANTEGEHAGWAVNEDGSLALTEQNFNDEGVVALAGATTFNFMSNAQEGDEQIKQVGKLYNLSNVYIPSASNRITELNIADYSFAGDLGAHTNWYAEEIQGIIYTPSKFHSIDFSDFMYYEISTNPADLYIENTTNTNLTLDSDFEIVLSQPVRQFETKARFNKTLINNLTTDLVINDGTKDLVKDTDYNVVVGQKVVGDAVKGVISIDMLNELTYGTTYTVTLPAHTANIARIKMAAANNHVATFTTEAAPSFDITIDAKEGLSSEGAAVEADAMAGKTVYFTANATNTTGRAVDGTIVIGIYNGEGNLVKVAAANKAFADAASNTFAASFKMEEGYTAKAFVKDTASEIAFQ